jgi:D-glycero-D-manno-heptose 1,7-bisphosphate phosphatase
MKQRWENQVLGRSAVFLDRDGVINENRPDHVLSWSQFRVLPGVAEAIRKLNHEGVPVFVITNQASVGRGLLSQENLDDIHSRMVRVLASAGARIETVYTCPHRPEDQCECRKPKPGLLEFAARSHGLDLSRSFVVGDAATDIQAGRACGCRTILVLTGRGRAQLAEKPDPPDYVALDLAEAALWIIGRLGSEE